MQFLSITQYSFAILNVMTIKELEEYKNIQEEFQKKNLEW